LGAIYAGQFEDHEEVLATLQRSARHRLPDSRRSFRPRRERRNQRYCRAAPEPAPRRGLRARGAGSQRRRQGARRKAGGAKARSRGPLAPAFPLQRPRKSKRFTSSCMPTSAAARSSKATRRKPSVPCATWNNPNLKGLLRRVIGKIFNDTEIKGCARIRTEESGRARADTGLTPGLRAFPRGDCTGYRFAHVRRRNHRANQKRCRQRSGGKWSTSFERPIRMNLRMQRQYAYADDRTFDAAAGRVFEKHAECSRSSRSERAGFHLPRASGVHSCAANRTFSAALRAFATARAWNQPSFIRKHLLLYGGDLHEIAAGYAYHIAEAQAFLDGT